MTGSTVSSPAQRVKDEFSLQLRGGHGVSTTAVVIWSRQKAAVPQCRGAAVRAEHTQEESRQAPSNPNSEEPHRTAPGAR